MRSGQRRRLWSRQDARGQLPVRDWPRRRLLRLSIVAIAALAAGCQPAPTALTSTPTLAAAAPSPAPATPPVATTPPSSSGLAHLVVSIVSVRLPEGVSRGVAFASGESLLLAGGLTASGTTEAILRIDLSGGRVTIDGKLDKPVHDAGGAIVRGLPMVFGGGNLVAGTDVQQLGAGQGGVVGQLPRPRADLAAVDIEGTAFVVGGGTPARLDPAVLATTDGSHFRTIAALLDPVRYPAVAVLGGSIIVVGGTDGVHDRSAIQVIDPATGAVRIVGHLPHGLSHAAAIAIAGRLLIAGGRTGGVAQDSIWEVDPASGFVSLAGRLPRAVSDAAAAVVGSTGYLVGGETGDFLTSVLSISIG